MQPHTVYEALQLATSPVILISACGLLLLSMTNRLGRAIDRAHLLVRDPNPNRQVQIDILVQRATWIRSAIIYTVTTISLTALLVFVLFLSVFLADRLQVVVVVLFVLSLLSLVASLGYFTADIFGSLRAMQVDIQSLATAPVSRL